MRRRFIVIAGIVLSAGSASAADLQGRWHFDRLGVNGRYFGDLVIDRGGQARLKGVSPTQHYSECGYAQVQGERIEIVFTSVWSEGSYNADHFYCRFTGGALACSNRDVAGNGNPAIFTLVRQGAVPATPAERLEDACPAGQSPRS